MANLRERTCQVRNRVRQSRTLGSVGGGARQRPLLPGPTKYAKAAECLVKDREALLAFFDFPAEHWDHLRTANPIESVFATVRHRTVRTKGALSHKTARLMVFKLVMAASKTWRRLKGQNRLPMIIEGVRLADGVAVTVTSANHAA